MRRLTGVAEEVSTTRDLSRRIDDSGTDELSRLASTFNTMLEALEDSARAQRRLVADASHELRTPLTSARTNIEVLARSDGMAPEEREQILRDVNDQLTEMSALVAELVELARGDTPVAAEAEDVRLDLVAADAIERTKRNYPGLAFDVRLEESVVHGTAASIERAVSNLIDNAAKWSPPGEVIEVSVAGARWSSATTAPASPTRTCPSSSTASTAPRRRAACPARASASRSCARWRTPTAARSAPKLPKAAARRCG